MPLPLVAAALDGREGRAALPYNALIIGDTSE